jgi:hypothetical protein
MKVAAMEIIREYGQKVEVTSRAERYIPQSFTVNRNNVGEPQG